MQGNEGGSHADPAAIDGLTQMSLGGISLKMLLMFHPHFCTGGCVFLSGNVGKIKNYIRQCQTMASALVFDARAQALNAMPPSQANSAHALVFE